MDNFQFQATLLFFGIQTTLFLVTSVVSNQCKLVESNRPASNCMNLTEDRFEKNLGLLSSLKLLLRLFNAEGNARVNIINIHS